MDGTVRGKNDIAAFSAVAAVRPGIPGELVLIKTFAAFAAVAGLDENPRLINKSHNRTFGFPTRLRPVFVTSPGSYPCRETGNSSGRDLRDIDGRDLFAVADLLNGILALTVLKRHHFIT